MHKDRSKPDHEHSDAKPSTNDGEVAEEAADQASLAQGKTQANSGVNFAVGQVYQGLLRFPVA